MRQPSGRSSAILSTTVVLFLLFLLLQWSHRFLERPSPGRPSDALPQVHTYSDGINRGDDEPWRWNADRDRDNHRLSHAQCSESFPLLYKELDRAAAFWLAREGQHGITANEIDLRW